MTSGRPTTGGPLLAATVALVAIAVGGVTNIFTGALPEHWTWAHDWRLWGAALVVLCGITVWLAVAAPGRAGHRSGFGYGRRYRRWVVAAANTLDTKGLITVGPTTPDLEAVFVDVALTEQAPTRVGPGLLGGAGGANTGRQSVWDFLDQPRRVVLVLLGAPGSGKTTLLRHVAREIAGRGRSRASTSTRRPVPVLVQLRDRVAAIVADPALDLPELIRGNLPGPVGPGPAGWWERRLRAGRCVVLLDGLDEVAGEDDRRAIVDWINRRLPAYPANDFVITSRPHGYRDSFVDTATTVQVLPFSGGQVERFLRNWYRAAEGDAVRGAEQADHLLAQLDARPALHDLTVNPLLLTMIAIVHRYGDEPGLPDNRAALYGEMCAVMLWRRDQEKGRRLEMPGPQRLALLARLARHLMAAGVRDMDRRVLRAELTGVDADRFLAEMEATGLLQEPAPRSIAFAHLTFQEYLAARHIAGTGEVGVLVQAVDDLWWRETTLLYAAEHDATPVVDAALRSGSARALSLAFEIADGDGDVAPELRDRLDDFLFQGLRSTAHRAHRQTAVEVLVSRLVRTAAITSSGTRVMRKPITTDLYRLFLAETGTPPPDVPMDEDADAPVRGVWRTDAGAFVEWINSLAGDGPRGPASFRLPSLREAESIRPADPVWVSGDQRFERVYSPAGALSPAGGPPVTTADLIDAATTDLHGSRRLADFRAGLVGDMVGQVGHHLQTVARTASDLHTATINYAQARRTGMSLAGESRARDLETDLGNRLDSAVRRLLRTVEDLRSTLNEGEGALAAPLSRLSLDPTRRILELIERDGIRQVAPVRSIRAKLNETAERLTEVQRRRHERPAQLAPWSPLDDILKPVTKNGLLPGPGIDGGPAFNPVETLVRRCCPEEPGPVDPASLPGVVQRLAGQVHAGHDHVLGRLARAAGPVVTRQTAVTAPAASAVRAAALILARQAREKSDHRLAGQLVTLAVGMTLLERRRQAPETLETLILAYD